MINEFERRLQKPSSVFVLGDFILDTYQFGQVERISPEAPVPVFTFQKEELRPGGAGNVVQNLRALGIPTTCLGVIGDDAPGAKLQHLLSKEQGADVELLIKSDRRSTPLKTRLIARQQQMIRIDRENVLPLTENEKTLLKTPVTGIHKKALVFISDYGKGIVSEELLACLRKQEVFMAVDPKGIHYEKYRGCHLITPNQQEAERATNMIIRDEESCVACLRKLHDMTQATYICMTRHEEGMVMLESHTGLTYSQPAWSRKDVFDVTGAGDTVLVFLGVALHLGLSIPDAMKLASMAAYVVIQKLGTQAVSLESLRQLLR